jgi:predicted transcriptional regulator
MLCGKLQENDKTFIKPNVYTMGMGTMTQFSMRMEPDLMHRVDEEAEKEYKTRTEIIKEALVKLLDEKKEKERMKEVATELWIKGEIPETNLKKVLDKEEIKDLKFGKQWIKETINEISR